MTDAINYKALADELEGLGEVEFDADFYALGEYALDNLPAILSALRRAGDLQQTVIAFCGPWAVAYARDFGLPDGHLHPTHYDILEQCGARMVNFTRADIARSALKGTST